MKRIIVNCLGILCLVLGSFTQTFFTGSLMAQDERVYSRLFYVDAKPGKGGEYRELVLDVGAKIAQARADAGQISSWLFLQARVPGGERANADYIVVSVMQDGFDSPSISIADALEKAGVDMSAEEYVEKRGEYTTLLDNDIWYTVEQVGDSEVGNFLLINYMDVHDMDDWLDIESNVVKPSMEAQVKDGGALAAWGSYRLYLPRGTDLPFNAGTVDVFADWSAVGKGGQFVKYIQMVHPDMDMSQLGPRIQKARDIIRSDLYEVLAKVTPSK